MTPVSEQTLVVVGAGHVAASAARALRRRGFAGSVVLVGDEPSASSTEPVSAAIRSTGLLVRRVTSLASHQAGVSSHRPSSPPVIRRSFDRCGRW